MRHLLVLAVLFSGIVAGDGFAATSRASRAGGGQANNAPAQKTTSARSARSATTAPNSAVRARSGTPVAARSVRTPAAGGAPVIKARAGVTQKVIGKGTKVTAAAKNIIVNEECQAKFDGCMDSFCMLDNDTGGRCLCSDKNAEYDAILAEIEKLDQQSYQMATFGVEKIEMGADADAAIANANAVAQSLVKEAEKEKSNKRSLDLSMWDVDFEFGEESDIFGEESSIDDKEGDALYRAATEICVAQMPECAGDMDMLRMMYGQRIKSDCTAYENSLKQQKTASQQKLSAAEKALREAALEQHRTANKYDLGQCTVQFKKCMQTTGGCGDDFAGCATMAAMDSTNVRQSTSQKSKGYQIKGAVTNIEITASTYDTLLSKQPLCEHITKSCVAVADKVWDAFLKEAAPQIKNAEIIAEDNARQNCIGNISACFQKACKDNIDPNDPDGSYDICLTRPESMLNLCKVPLNACGIQTKSADDAKQSDIWDFVVARLASMRVDACTNDVKNCLQSDDRCGKDYAKCIGLDLQALKDMCPMEKLVGCQSKTTDGGYKAKWSDFENIVQGIWLGIDNAMLDQCLNLVNEKMIEICGDTASCAAFDDDNAIGTESLISYSDENGNYVIDGLVSFGNITVNRVTSRETSNTDDSSNPKITFGLYEIDINDYKNHLTDTDPSAIRVVSALQSAATKINQKIAILSQDPKIDMCLNGRDLSQISERKNQRGTSDNTESKVVEARFPYLLDSSVLAIISSGLDRANKNYEKKYNELLSKALEQKDDAVKSVLCAAMASQTEPKCTSYKTTESGEAVCTAYKASIADNVFNDGSDTGLQGADSYSTKFIIPGAKLSTLAKVQQEGRSEYTMTDSLGSMIGKVVMSSVYSPDSNMCTLTTVTTMCSKMKEIVTTNKTTSCGNGGIQILGGSGCGGGGGILGIGGSKKKVTITQKYEGVACLEFMEPQTTTSELKM